MLKSLLQSRYWPGRASAQLQAALLFKQLPLCVADLPKRSHQKQSALTYFEWLFLQPIENPPQKLIPAIIRIKAR
jgi:hypothetical protein